MISNAIEGNKHMQVFNELTPIERYLLGRLNLLQLLFQNFHRVVGERIIFDAPFTEDGFTIE